MRQSLLLLPALAGLLLSPFAQAATITQDFSTDPLQSGWAVFGNTNLFNWNSTNHNLEVTWDSSQPNSYFYHRLGTLLSRSDDFSIDFDLLLKNIASNTESNKTGPFEIALGFFNLATATSTNFMRGVFGGAPGLFELDYFPTGYYDFGGIFDVVPTITPTFISTNGSGFAPSTFSAYEFELPTNVVVHFSMNFAASNQTLMTFLTTNGSPWMQLTNVVLTDTNMSTFSDTDDFRVDTFSISSYSSAGDDYDSVLGVGTVDNISISFPLPIQGLTGGFSNTLWQVQFVSRSNWVYTLERAPDLHSWTDVSLTIAGNATTLFLQDTNPPPDAAFYRVRAMRP